MRPRDVFWMLFLDTLFRCIQRQSKKKKKKKHILRKSLSTYNLLIFCLAKIQLARWHLKPAVRVPNYSILGDFVLCYVKRLTVYNSVSNSSDSTKRQAQQTSYKKSNS